MTTDLPPLRDVIKAHGLQAKKSFGQNFLLDLNLTGKIARIPGDLSNNVVYEVGPGPGGLTRALLTAGAKRVVAVEMDPRCLPALAELSAHFDNRLTVIQGDGAKMDDASVVNVAPDEQACIVANLPYNVGTLMYIKWLTLADWKPWYQSLTLMFQQEVADRIVAKPGTKAYGRLSVLTQWRGKAKIAMRVPPAAFTPAPKVSSAIIHYQPTEPLDATVKLRDLERVVELAFGQRRKMLRASLKGLGVNVAELLGNACIEPTLRAENIDVAGFVTLAGEYAKMKG